MPRMDTDVFPPHGQGMMEDRAWAVSDLEPPTSPTPAQRKRVRPRPHKKYETPEEMWAWHWVRMRIMLTWVMVAAISSVVLTAGVIIFTELT